MCRIARYEYGCRGQLTWQILKQRIAQETFFEYVAGNLGDGAIAVPHLQISDQEGVCGWHRDLVLERI